MSDLSSSIKSPELLTESTVGTAENAESVLAELTKTRSSIASLCDSFFSEIYSKILEIYPDQFIERAALLNPKLEIYTREQIEKDPSLLLIQFKNIEDRFPTHQLNENEKKSLFEFQLTVSYLVNGVTRLSFNETLPKPTEQGSIIRSLEQNAFLVLILLPEVKQLLHKLELPKIEAALVKAEKVDAVEAVTGEELGDHALEKAKTKEKALIWINRLTSKPVLIGVAVASATAAVCTVGYLLMYNVQTLAIVAATIAVLYAGAKFLRRLNASFGITARLGNIFRIGERFSFLTSYLKGLFGGGSSGGGGGGSSGGGTDREEEKSQSQLGAAAPRRRTTNISADGRPAAQVSPLDIAEHGSGVSTWRSLSNKGSLGVVRGTVELRSSLGTTGVYVIKESDGSLERLDLAIGRFPKQKAELFTKLLYETKTFKPEKEEFKEEQYKGESFIELPIARDKDLYLPLPAGYRITKFRELDKDGKPLDSKVTLERCRLGGVRYDPSPATYSVQYVVKKIAGTDIRITEKQTKELMQLLPKVRAFTGLYEHYFVKAMKELNLSPVDCSRLICAHRNKQNFRYSDAPFVGGFLYAAGDALAEAISGLKMGTCDPFAFLSATDGLRVGVPSFSAGGLVFDGSGFKADAAHAIALSLLPGRPVQVKDLTTVSRSCGQDVSKLTWAKQRVFLNRLSGATFREVFEIGVAARKAISEAKSDDLFAGLRRFLYIIQSEKKIDGVETEYKHLNDIEVKRAAINYIATYNVYKHLQDEAYKSNSFTELLDYYLQYPHVTKLTDQQTQILPQPYADHSLADDFSPQSVVCETISKLLMKNPNNDLLFEEAAEFIRTLLPQFRIVDLNSLAQIATAKKEITYQNWQQLLTAKNLENFDSRLIKELLLGFTNVVNISTSNLREDVEAIPYAVDCIAKITDELMFRNLNLYPVEKLSLTEALTCMATSFDDHGKENLQKLAIALGKILMHGPDERVTTAFQKMIPITGGYRDSQFNDWHKAVGAKDFIFSAAEFGPIEDYHYEQFAEVLMQSLKIFPPNASSAMFYADILEFFRDSGFDFAKLNIGDSIATAIAAVVKQDRLGININFPRDGYPASQLSEKYGKWQTVHAAKLSRIFIEYGLMSEDQIVAAWPKFDETLLEKVLLESLSFYYSTISTNSQILNFGIKIPLEQCHTIARQFLLPKDRFHSVLNLNVGRGDTPHEDQATLLEIIKKHPVEWQKKVSGSFHYIDLAPKNSDIQIALSNALLNAHLEKIDQKQLYLSIIAAPELITLEKREELRRLIAENFKPEENYRKALEIISRDKVIDSKNPKFFSEISDAELLTMIVLGKKYSSSWTKVIKEALEKAEINKHLLTLVEFDGRKKGRDLDQRWSELFNGFNYGIPADVSSGQWLSNRDQSQDVLTALYQFRRNSNVRVKAPRGDFFQFVQYAPGDDIRSVDWRRYAQNPDHILRRDVREEETRSVTLIYDLTSLLDLNAERKFMNELQYAVENNVDATVVLGGRTILATFDKIVSVNPSADYGTLDQNKLAEMAKYFAWAKGVFYQEFRILEENLSGINAIGSKILKIPRNDFVKVAIARSNQAASATVYGQLKRLRKPYTRVV